MKTISDSEGNEVKLPTKWEICSLCRGEGKNSLAVDGHGITSEEWERDWDDESREFYFRGGYDRECEECKGSGKVEVVDEDRLTEEQKALWLEHCQDEAEYRAAVDMERRMGA